MQCAYACAKLYDLDRAELKRGTAQLNQAVNSLPAREHG
jgi:hypothetical protein